MQRLKTNSGALYAASKDDMLGLFVAKKRKVFDIIWNLAVELRFLESEEKKHAKVVICEAIVDYDVPFKPAQFKKHLGQTINCLKSGGSVLVHCLGGHGRTGMVAAILLSKINNIPLAESLKLAQLYCQGPETEEQIQFVFNTKC